VPRPWHLRAAAEDTAFLIPFARQLQHRYATLRMPVTIITGLEDKVVTPAHHSLRLHHDIAGSRLVGVPGAGHMIHHLALDQVTQAIERAGEGHQGHGDEHEKHPTAAEQPSHRPAAEAPGQAMRG
jgi:pimeloyl-ACP methyl ester carboxylesterase